MPVRLATGYPNRALASSTGAGLTIFMTPSSSMNNVVRAVRTRPAQIIFLEPVSVSIAFMEILPRIGFLN